MIVLLKAWRIPTLAGAAAGYALALLLVAAPIPVPGRDFSDVLWPALPIVVVGAAVLSRRVLADVPFEARHPHRARRRTAVALGALLAVAVSTVAVTPWAAVDPAVAIRNAALMLGVVALCGPRGGSTAVMR